MKKRNKFLSIICCFVMALLCVIPFAACNSNGSYTITYNLNYDNNVSREVTVPRSALAVNWQPERVGYELEGWYKNAECTNRYNFHKRVTKDVTLYAKWNKSEQAVITFDENFAGKRNDTLQTAKKGELFDSLLAPAPSRLGYEFVGWYKDAECKTAWNFDADVVEDDITLYAGYADDNSLQRDFDGNPVFDNVTVNVWLGTGYFDGNANVIWNIAKQFNRDPEYMGKIKVNVSFDLTSQDFYSLRFQHTATKNDYDDEYYSVNEIYNLAGIEYNPADYYQNASRDCYVENRLGTVPIIAGVPYMVYNKQLFAKYNGDNAFPSSFSEFGELMRKVYQGEVAVNPDFKTLLTGNATAFMDSTAAAAFVQNGAPYNVCVDGVNRNIWEQPAVRARVNAAFTNAYAMLGAQGANYGTLTGDEGDDMTARNKVSKGDALFGIVSWPNTVFDVCKDANVGIAPISGLFSDDAEYKNLIPVHTYGFAFYRAKGLSSTELAAAGIFADYVSKHSHAFAQNGWYPLNKSVVESDEIQNSSNEIVKLLLQAGDPENFFTQDGHANATVLAREIAAKRYLVPALNGDGTGFDAVIDRLIISLKNA